MKVPVSSWFISVHIWSLENAKDQGKICLEGKI